MSNHKLDTSCGNNWTDVAQKAKEIARVSWDETLTVEYEFNGVICLVNKNTNLEWLWRDYSNSWLMGWKTVGPDCVENYSSEVQKEYDQKKAVRDEKEEQRRIQQAAKDKSEQEIVEAKIKDVTLEIIPEKATDYLAHVEKNSHDGYSRGVIDYAENWAKLMQVEIAKGKTVREVAEQTQQGLGYLGITGYMYGCVVGTLSHFWKHGEELRKWHNKEYGHEGDGVVNPAILTLKS